MPSDIAHSLVEGFKTRIKRTILDESGPMHTESAICQKAFIISW